MNATLLFYELMLGLTAVQRLAELGLSRHNLAQLSPAARTADSPVNWGALVVLQVAWLSGSAIEPAWRGSTALMPLFAVGLGLFALGAVLRVWCILSLGGGWNARARVDPGLRIVSCGPYRFVRHPNYAGVLLELIGLPLAGAAWWTLLCVAPPHIFVLWRRIRGEDALLFGLPGYSELMGTKGALLPRLVRR
jgi:methyltransferase